MFKTRNRRLVGLLPIDPFAIQEPQDQEIGEYYAIQKRRASDFLETPKL